MSFRAILCRAGEIPKNKQNKTPNQETKMRAENDVRKCQTGGGEKEKTDIQNLTGGTATHIEEKCHSVKVANSLTCKV